MEMHQIRYFLAVSETLNFTRAAEKCNVAQPSLTRAIQKLEDELGGELFRRERNHTHLTELGKLMLPHLEQTLRAAEAAKVQARTYHKADIAPLGLGIAESVCSSLMTPVMRELDQTFPGFELSLCVNRGETLIERMLHGDLDMAVLPDSETLPDRLHRWTLFSESCFLALADDHPLSACSSLSIEDLEGIALVERAGCNMTESLRTACAAQGVTLGKTHRVDSEAAHWHLVQAGLGVAVVPERCGPAASVTLRALNDFSLWRDILLATPAGRRFAPAPDAFIKLCRARDWSDISALRPIHRLTAVKGGLAAAS